MFFPRSFMGSRGQIMVNSITELNELIEKENGKFPLFISNCSYPTHGNDKVIQTDNIRVSHIFIDLDSWPKIENAFGDARKLRDWCDNHNLPYLCAFSGKKGTHFLIKLEPAIYSLKNKIYLQSNDWVTVKDYYKSFQRQLKIELGLRTLDNNCREPRRIRRLWNSIYIKNGQPNGHYCVPMKPEQLDDSVPEILDYATQPHTVNPHWNEGRDFHTFDRLMDKFDVDPTATRFKRDGEQSVVNYKQGDVNWSWLKGHLPHKCLHNSLHNDDNPPHGVRLAACIWWRMMADMAPVIENDKGERIKITYSPEWVDNLFRAMKKDDHHNHEFRWAQIQSVWNSNYSMPTCAYLYEWGVCVGKECDRYEKYLQKIRGKSE